MTRLSQNVQMASIKSQLSAEDPDQRRQAIYTLEDVPPDFSMPFLINGIQDDNRAVREAAAAVLEMQPANKAAPRLLELLSSDRIEVRNAAAAVLVSLGPGASVYLIPYLKDSSGDIRKFSADILGLTRCSEAVSELCYRALNDTMDSVIEASIEALGKIGDSQALDTLYQLYQQHQGNEPEILEAIGLIRAADSVDFLLQIMEDEDPLINFAIVDALGNIGDERALVPLQIYLPEAPDYLTEHICRAILQIGKTSGVKVFHSDQEAFLNGSLDLLVSQDDECSELISYQLQFDLEDRVISALYGAADRLMSSILIALLKQTTRHHDYPGFVLKLIEHEDEWVAYSALRFARELPSPALQPVLRKVLQGQSSLLKLSALQAVEFAGLEAMRPVVSKLAQAEDPELKAAAEQILAAWQGTSYGS